MTWLTVSQKVLNFNHTKNIWKKNHFEILWLVEWYWLKEGEPINLPLFNCPPTSCHCYNWPPARLTTVTFDHKKCKRSIVIAMKHWRTNIQRLIRGWNRCAPQEGSCNKFFFNKPGLRRLPYTLKYIPNVGVLHLRRTEKLSFNLRLDSRKQTFPLEKSKTKLFW